MAFLPLDMAQILDTEERRLSLLNAVLEDGDTTELKNTLASIAESKGIKDLDLSNFGGDAFDLMRVLKRLGFGLQPLNEPKCQSA